MSESKSKSKTGKLPKITTKEEVPPVPLFLEPPKSILVIRKELATYITTTLEESRDKDSWYAFNSSTIYMCCCIFFDTSLLIASLLIFHLFLCVVYCIRGHQKLMHTLEQHEAMRRAKSSNLAKGQSFIASNKMQAMGRHTPMAKHMIQYSNSERERNHANQV